MPDLLSVYHALPYPLKVVAASLHGARLNLIRYPKDTDDQVEAALARENWDAAQWKNWQEDRLSRMLKHAATNVPYYRNKWAERCRNGDRASSEYLENWPLLHKEELRASRDAFIADGMKKRSLVLDHTSGSTGVPLSLWMSLQAVRTGYVLFEARWRRWYGVSRHDRWGILGGQMVIPFSRSKPPFWVWNFGMNQLYLSTFHISPQFTPAYLDAIRQYKLVYLYGYASSLYDVARFALEQQCSIPALKVILSNAEPLYPYQREIIQRAFHCPVIDTYGQAENVCAASECSAGRMHLWPEVGVTEVMADESDQPVMEGEVGRLICTGLLNLAMPLIRYEIGDRGSLSTQKTECSCKRTLPMIGGIEGRTEDMIVTRDGRRIEAADTVFKSEWPIREAQIIQETLDRIRVCVVPAPGFNTRIANLLISGLQDRIGKMEITLEEVSTIPRTKAGKRKVIVSYVDKPG